MTLAQRLAIAKISLDPVPQRGDKLQTILRKQQ